MPAEEEVERTSSSSQHDTPTHDDEKPHDAELPAATKKPSLLKRIWAKAGLDVPTVMMMAKFVFCLQRDA